MNIIKRLNPGDIILTSRDSLIVKFMRIFQSDPIKYGHALVVRNDRDAYESLKSVAIIPLTKIFKKRKHYAVLRYKHLTYKNAIVMNKELNKLVGNTYSYKRILLQIFDHVFDTNYFTKLMKDPRNQVCSSLVAWAYYVATGIRFNGVDWKACDPDDLHDHVLSSSDEWEIIEEV